MDNEGKNIHGNDHVMTAAEAVTLKKQRNEDVESQCDEEILTISEKINSADEHKILVKLHRLFANASADRLQRLLTSSGNKDAECSIILQRNVSEYETCQIYSKTKPKPAVGLSLASQYNETVAVNLHELEPAVSPHY